MSQVDYKFVLTDKDYNDIAQLTNVHRRQYSKFLNNIGQAYFEVYQDNPLIKSLNINPLTTMYGLKIYRGDTLIWQGMIDGITPSDKTKNSMDIIGFQASSRLADFGDVLINTSSDSPTTRDSLANKKIGTEVIQVLFDECKAKSSSPISDITSDISDPLDETGAVNTMQDQDSIFIDSLLSVVAYLADITGCDFYLDDVTKIFQFKDRIGTSSSAQFRYVEFEQGNNINNFSLQLDIREINNHPIGFSTGSGENVKIISDITDSASISAFKLREKLVDVRALDSEASIKTQMAKQLSLYSKPRYFSSISLTQSTGLLDGWQLGDTVEIWIKRGIINFREKKRIMGFTVSIDEQDMENITLNYQDPV